MTYNVLCVCLYTFVLLFCTLVHVYSFKDINIQIPMTINGFVLQFSTNLNELTQTAFWGITNLKLTITLHQS